MKEKLRQLKDEANAHIQKRRYRDALKIYHQCLKIDSGNLRFRQKMAELLVRIGENAKAIEIYQGIAGAYAMDGVLLKAIAMNKMILNIDPKHTETQDVLAQLYGRQQGRKTAFKMPEKMSVKRVEVKEKHHVRKNPTVATNWKEMMAALNLDLEATELEQTNLDTEWAQTQTFSTQATNTKVSHRNLDIPKPPQLGEKEFPQEGVTAQTLELYRSDVLKVLDVTEQESADSLEQASFEILSDESSIFEGEDFLFLEESVSINPEQLPPVPLFNELSSDVFKLLTEKMNIHQAEDGEKLLSEGEIASRMYIIIEGKIDIRHKGHSDVEQSIAMLGDGEFFGEIAFLSQSPRTTSAYAVGETLLFEISRELLESMYGEYPQVAKVMQRFQQSRLLTNLLSQSPLFKPFAAGEKKKLIEKFQSRYVGGDELLLRANHPGKCLYLLLSGRCEVSVKNEKQQKNVLAELRNGDVFGEFSTIFHQNASATVRSKTPCIVLRLEQENFHKLKSEHPECLDILTEIAMQRADDNLRMREIG